jgi:hypothetical protein
MHLFTRVGGRACVRACADASLFTLDVLRLNGFLDCVQFKEKAMELEAKKMAANGAAPTSSKTRNSQKPGTADYASRRRELLQKRMQARSVSAQGPAAGATSSEEQPAAA